MATIALLGLDVLGQSLGRALRQETAWSRIVGYDATYTVQQEAKRADAIEVGANSAVEAVARADVVIVNETPARTISLLRDLAPHFKAGSVVTDTAATKVVILRESRASLDASVSFVGGHPVVPDAGIVDPALFQKRPWFLVPDEAARDDAISVVSSMVEIVGANPHFVDAVEHDSWSAAVEQLPVVLAAALVLSAGSSDSWRDMQQLAGSVFRDASRVVTREPLPGAASLATNTPALLYWFDAYLERLTAVREHVLSNDSEAIDALFQDAASIRAAWERAERGLFAEDAMAVSKPQRGFWSIKTPKRRRNS